jgi:hypothetical protein
MSKLHFLLKYGSLDKAKQAVASSDTERMGHAHAMDKLLDRMKTEGDPDYAKVRDDHMGDFAKDRIKASWIVSSKHITPEHLKTIAGIPHMQEFVAKNPNADADTLRVLHDKSIGDQDGHVTRKRITQHTNAPEDLIQHMHANDPSLLVRAYARDRIKNGRTYW